MDGFNVRQVAFEAKASNYSARILYCAPKVSLNLIKTAINHKNAHKNVRFNASVNISYKHQKLAAQSRFITSD